MKDIIEKFNGEKWRIITPLMLLYLSGIATADFFLIKEINERVKRNSDKLESHVEHPFYHNSVFKDVEWLKEQLREKKGG